MTDFEDRNPAGDPEQEELEDDVIELIGEDGETVRFEYLTTIEYEGAKYIVLLPEEEAEDEDEGDVVILEIQEDENGDDVYVSVEDDELLEKVFQEFLRVMDEQEEDEE